MTKITTSPLSSKTNYWGVRTFINPNATRFVTTVSCLFIIAWAPIMPCRGDRQCIESMGLPYNYPDLTMYVLYCVLAFSYCYLSIGNLGMNQSERVKNAKIKKDFHERMSLKCQHIIDTDKEMRPGPYSRLIFERERKKKYSLISLTCILLLIIYVII